MTVTFHTLEMDVINEILAHLRTINIDPVYIWEQGDTFLIGLETLAQRAAYEATYFARQHRDDWIPLVDKQLSSNV